MDGGRALQLKHEINVESTIIERGTAKRDRDQHLVYIGWGKAPCIGFQTYASSNIPTIKAEKLDFEKGLANLSLPVERLRTLAQALSKKPTF